MKYIKIATTTEEFYKLEKYSKVGDKIIWLSGFYSKQDIHVLKKQSFSNMKKFYDLENVRGETKYEED